MKLYLACADGDDIPQEPLLANDVAEAAEIYVQATLDGKTSITIDALRRGRCINIGGFEPPEGGRGLMKDFVSTSVPMTHISAWRDYLASKDAGGPSP